MTANLTPKQRVQAALAHETTDRPPFHATFTPEFATRLRAHFNLPPGDYDPHHRTWYDYDLEIACGEDLLEAGAGWVTTYYLHDEPFTDAWGIGWVIDEYKTPFGTGHYTNPHTRPLGADEPDLSNFHAPDANDPAQYEHVERLVGQYGDEYFTVGRVHCTIFELAWALRGFENLLVDLMMDPDLANQILDVVAGYHKDVAVNMAKRGVDMVWLGDDWGAQNSSIVSVDTWNEFFKPRYADICSAIKAVNPNIHIGFHSDGCVYNMIPGLIDVGVDVLNPIQTECMDPAYLKREYGDKLSFFGGVAVQSTLPLGSPADIQAEFKWLRETLGAGGGWICAPTHHVQLDTPIENFIELTRCIQSCSTL